MLTALFSLNKVNGAEIWLFAWFCCALGYFGLALLAKQHRTLTGIKNLAFWFLAAAILTDLVWALLYYDHVNYVNRGIGAVYGFLLWPLALVTAGIFAGKFRLIRKL